MLSHVLYINLKSREDRNLHVLNELKQLNITNPIRIDAIKNENGAIGCSMSHIKCLEYAKSNHFPNVFICEDDITFTNPSLLLSNINQMETSNINWDVVIIGGNNCPPYTKINDYCIKVTNNQTTTGYIVQSHYYDTLLQNIRESTTRLLREPHNHRFYALDIFWKQLQQKDKWYMIIPPTVIQYEDYSDIEKQVVNYNVLMLDLDKTWLFQQPPPPR
jgi:glycosyl transferase family 25